MYIKNRTRLFYNILILTFLCILSKLKDQGNVLYFPRFLPFPWSSLIDEYPSFIF